MRGRLGLQIAAALIGVALIEMGLRLFAPDLTPVMRLFEESADSRPFVLRPGARVEYEGFGSSLGRSVLWQVNPQGLREDRTVGAPGGRFRVATYGDSQAFGWSVTLDETFQRRMQAIDPQVEVLNLAVPGYNVADTSEHMRRTLAAFEPQLAVLLATKNDFDRSLEIGTVWGLARILTWARLIYQLEFSRSERQTLRHSPERKQFFADELDRMIRFCEAQGVPLMIGFTRWQNRQDWLDHLRPDHWLAVHRDGIGSDGFRVDLVNVKETIRGIPEADRHLSAPAYQAMAELFCRRISGSPQGERCVPPDWRPPQPERGAAAGRAGLG